MDDEQAELIELEGRATASLFLAVEIWSGLARCGVLTKEQAREIMDSALLRLESLHAADGPAARGTERARDLLERIVSRQSR